VFISYRQGGRDSGIAAAIHNTLSGFALGEQGEHVTVFWDVKSLESGQQFDTNFMRALSKTMVFSPLITPHTLKRMTMPDSYLHLDNVLLEWWLGLTLYKNSGFSLQSVIPVCFGTVSSATSSVVTRPCI
jgi:hypothetical protein